MTESKTLETIIEQLEEIFTSDEWRNVPLSTRIRDGIDGAKANLVNHFGDAVVFGDERLEGPDAGFDYTIKTRLMSQYSVNLNLKEFE